MGIYLGSYNFDSMGEIHGGESSEIADNTTNEISSYLNRVGASRRHVGWRKFEEIINGILRANGFLTILTGESKDKGADIIVSQNEKTVLILECKTRSSSKIEVAQIRELAGACISWDTNRAILVSNAPFTKGSVEFAKDIQQFGYFIDLLDATNLLKMLDLANVNYEELIYKYRNHHDIKNVE